MLLSPLSRYFQDPGDLGGSFAVLQLHMYCTNDRAGTTICRSTSAPATALAPLVAGVAPATALPPLVYDVAPATALTPLVSVAGPLALLVSVLALVH